jgi:putative transposase
MWCKEHQIQLTFIQSGKPIQNGFVERLNRTYREDVLDAYLFQNLKQLKVISEEWLADYNAYHPHQLLQGYSPIGYRHADENNLTSIILNQPKSNQALP